AATHATALMTAGRGTLARVDRARPQAKDPAFWLSHLLGGLHFLLLRNDRTPAERVRALTARLEDVPQLLDDARAALVEPVRLFVETALSMTAGGRLLVRDIGTTPPCPGRGEAERLQAAADRASAALAGFERDRERWLEAASDRFG